jgi:adenosylcobinamide kinase/adenosylcobinamide-phosphate guanylyltransferase
MRRVLILGGARSGKSGHAQMLAEQTAERRHGGRLVMIATAEALDDEMADRIARHKGERGPAWRTIEAPVELAAAIDSLGEGDVAVVDCLTLWLSNLLCRDADIGRASAALLCSIEASRATLMLVSNEVGFGIVPDNALARRFRDEAGRLHQRIAASADQVLLMVAGQCLVVKPARS